MTPEQERFLCDFADKEIARIAEKKQKNEDVEKLREVERARDAFLKDLRSKKEAEIADAIATFEAKPFEEKLQIGTITIEK
jgi:hypothetical protein